MITKTKILTSWILFTLLINIIFRFNLSFITGLGVAGLIIIAFRDPAYERESFVVFIKKQKTLTVFIALYSLIVIGYIVYLLRTRSAGSVPAELSYLLFISLTPYVLPLILHDMYLIKNITNRLSSPVKDTGGTREKPS